MIAELYKSIALVHPRIEVLLRQIYWHFSTFLKKYNPNNNRIITRTEIDQHIDFYEIICQLKKWGVKEGALLIVHSSYDNLSVTGLNPIEIISKLRELIGDSGTLAMPVIRNYIEEPEASQKIHSTYRPPKCLYNPKKTPITSGILPNFLLRTKNSEISLHPLNPLCAVGPLAKDMMEGNIEGNLPSPHGVNSAWKFCLDHNAFIIGLGTDLRHHNTMVHVAEESFNDWYWGVDDWYNKRDFVIQTNNGELIEKTVLERKPRWGMLHLAEINRYHDLLKNSIIKSKKIGPVLLELESSQDLIKYLRSRNKYGYPYYK